MTALINPFILGEPEAPTPYRDLLVATVPGLVHYWPMDGGTDELGDQVGATDLTNTGATFASGDDPGLEGTTGSWDFDGTADRMTAAVTLGVRMLIGGWFFTDQALTTHSDAIQGRWETNNGIILYTVDGHLEGKFGGSNCSGSTLITSGWHLGMFLSTGGTGATGRVLFLDDAEDGFNSAVTGHGVVGSSTWEVASYADAGVNTFWDGRLCHLFVADYPTLGDEPTRAETLTIAQTLYDAALSP